MSKKKPIATNVPTLIPYERLKELELGDRIWQAYVDATEKMKDVGDRLSQIFPAEKEYRQ